MKSKALRLGWETPKAKIYDFIATQNALLISGGLIRDGDEISNALRFEWSIPETV